MVGGYLESGQWGSEWAEYSVHRLSLRFSAFRPLSSPLSPIPFSSKSASPFWAFSSLPRSPDSPKTPPLSQDNRIAEASTAPSDIATLTHL